MFIGHYAASLAAKRAADTPLWVLFAAAMLLDIIWAVLILAGLERVEADPIVGLVFVSNPHSHSLVGAIGWAVTAFVVARIALPASTRSAMIVATVVLSHWFLDLLVHRADLPLWPGSDFMVGLGLWDYPALAMVGEILLFLAAGFWLWRSNDSTLRASGRLLAFLLFAAVLMLVMSQAPPPTEIEPVALGATFLVIHLLFVLMAWLVERRTRPARPHDR